MREEFHFGERVGGGSGGGEDWLVFLTLLVSLSVSLQGDVFFYYGLVNYYQNHRRYVKSRDDNQLLGKKDRVASECQPFQKATNGSDIDITPCGAIANSKFNGLVSSFLPT